ncbi:site-specific integrase [Enterococcus sp. DIV0242_7C1]|uniref:Tyr recombinase domain-containing protein n=2 Tax=Candidatus Enterococcus dunnyi TaxID=1834192 RepID=A0AAQ3W3Y9_9ENTE|nr:site-specific integrase [Enterococcus sp. DIV0242_7C1]MBO0471752.1 site-specific integrase [Enterococcus sp. DIV0242_7C1]
MVKKGENIYKRKDGRWEGRYRKGRDEYQKITYGYVYGKKYSEVKEKLTIIKAKTLTLHTFTSNYNGTVENWMIYWLDNVAKKQIKRTTYYSYLRLTKNHILSILGDQKICDLTKNDLQDFVDLLEMKGLSSGTIRNIFNIIKKGLDSAVNKNYLESNPCSGIVLPQYRRKKVQALTLAQQKKLEVLAFQEQGCSPIILALYSGMRIGEISGLKWTDINFEENLIQVKRTVSRILNEEGITYKTKVDMDKPKTWDSERIIPLAENLKKYLLERRRKQDSEYVVSCKGRFAEPRVINYRFQKIVSNLDIGNIHFHVLRHTFATRCLENGADIASLSRLMGHQSTRMTLDIYTDSLLEKRQEVIQTLDQRLA